MFEKALLEAWYQEKESKAGKVHACARTVIIQIELLSSFRKVEAGETIKEENCLS